MCELFGVCAAKSFEANKLLKAFYQHCDAHPDGWGLAVFRGGAVTMEKEPMKATDSQYLRHRLSCRVEGSNLLAHIRLATVGQITYANCHPFVWDDDSGRTWTMIHNGTLFDPSLITPYSKEQEGGTDSEGVLLYLMDCINTQYHLTGHNLNREERFAVLNNAVVRLAKDNKLNMILYDGEVMYVHTNYKDSLHVWQTPGRSVFVTKPLPAGNWEPLPLNQLIAYKDGEVLQKGTQHSYEFLDEEHDYASFFATFAEL